MALARFTKNCISTVYRENTCGPKLLASRTQRNFSLGQMRMDSKRPEVEDHQRELIQVDYLSKLALVVDRQYKTFKDVPVYLPYNRVYRARDKFRIKASVGTAIFIIALTFYSIQKNQNTKRMREYETLVHMHGDAQK